ncbi:MAG TPA: tRNA pseudouridine(55) synthase TruB, partial [Syntrophomonas sp.]|nr:tRNA pseudouridine(55) synthase TruB [Syntrophomonas sp.]
MHGFLNINKDPGMTSFDVLKKIKKIIPKTKLGHLGTLDPMAAGVLPVAMGHATRLIEYIEDSDKTYHARMTLGGVSDTQDAWGNIERTGCSSYRSEDLLKILTEFTGTIKQIPPMYSAVHHQGQRLYELARQGLEVERIAREIEIKSLQMLRSGEDTEGNPTIELVIKCSKGTYIRTICHD